MDARVRALALASSLAVTLVMNAPSAEAACTAPTCTKIIDNGPDAGKKILVVLGDGYASADQTKWVNDVNNLVVNGVFAQDFFKEDQNAFNVYRLNLVSTDSGVSQVRYDEKGTPNGSDDTVLSRTNRNTALGYIYSGSWSHCWMEWGANTSTAITNALTANVPNYNYWLVILNDDGFGGCGGGGAQTVTRSSGWPVVAHEYGHGIGGLSDEYSVSGAYSGSAVNGLNCSTVVNRSTVFWNRFIAPSTAMPTTFAAGMDSNRTVGMFEGCSTLMTGIYKPVNNCRMSGNSPPYCPVCWTLMKKGLYPFQAHNFLDMGSGDFSGDGKSDLLIHNGQDLALYHSSGANMNDQVWMANNIVPGASGPTWQPATHDQYLYGDFDGDGKEDVFVFNGSDWVTPYFGMLKSNGTGLGGAARYDGAFPGFWSMTAGDQFFVGDFDGDGKKDIAVFNGSNWGIPYLGIFRSTGTGLAGVARYDGSIPGWSMTPGDRLFVGDFDGDGKSDLFIFNGVNWSYRYLGMLKSSGAGVSAVKVFSSSLPGWSMTKGDQFFVGDFDGDHKADLYVFNKDDWAWAYLLMARSTGTDLAYVRSYNSSTGDAANIPGWQMRKGDRMWLSDANRDGKKDLFVFNQATDWSTEYLGSLVSNGTGLTGSWNADWVGGWNLGAVDQFVPSHYSAAGGTDTIFVHNQNWLGLLRTNGGPFVMDRIYYHWIYNAPYDSRPWSDSLP